MAGTALEGLERIMSGQAVRSFQAIGGLHHARRSRSAGFCGFNDLGVVIDSLRSRFGIARIGYVDIDVHHGDGIYYPYEADPDLIVVDIHEDGKFLYPGTGHAHEIGRDQAEGTITLGLIGTFQFFDQIFVMTAGGPFNSTRTIVFDLYDRFYRLDLGAASAVAYVLLAILAALSYVQIFLFERRR